MVTKSVEPGMFNCITSDITNNKHIPVDDKLDGCRVDNGNVLYNMENGDVYKYDLENKRWMLQ